MLKVITYPDNLLRQKTEPVKDPTDNEIKKLISEMLETLRSQEGIGLAAPQVGSNKRICLIELENEVFILINPEIKKLSGSQINLEEGCLSFPGKFISVPRYEKIKVKALDSNGKKQIIRARGLLARALQHEIDHLDGVLFVDRVTDQ